MAKLVSELNHPLDGYSDQQAFGPHDPIRRCSAISWGACAA